MTDDGGKQMDCIPDEQLAKWLDAYGQSSLSSYVRERLQEAASRLRAYSEPGFGSK